MSKRPAGAAPLPCSGPRAALLPTARPWSEREALRQPRALTEAQEGRLLASWLRKRQNILFCHVPNEGDGRGAIGNAHLVAQGLQKGAPDYLIFTPPPFLVRCPGVAIELKRETYSPSDVSPEQQRWLSDLRALGWQTTVAGGCADAVRFLNGLGYV